MIRHVVLLLTLASAAWAQLPTSPVEPWEALSRGSLRSILAPKEDLRLSSRAAGVVEKIHLPEGSPVKAGDPLISLDSQLETAEVANATALLRGTEADLTRTESDFSRAQAMRTDNIISPKQFEEFKAAFALAKSKRDQAAANLDLTKARLEYRTVRSPIDGIFLKTNKAVGESVERLETIARVVDPSVLRFTVYCDAALRGRFALEQTVQVRMEKDPQQPTLVSGKIFHIDPIIDAASGTFRIIVQLMPSADAEAGVSAVLIVSESTKS